MLYTVNSTEFLLTLNQTTHYHENESLNPEIDNFDLHHAAPSPDPVIFSKPILSLRIVVIESKFPKDFGDDNYFYPNMIHNTTFCMESEDRDPFIYLIKKSIDDEYTPGLFRIDEIISKSSRRQLSGYLQWKPLFFDRLFPTNYRDSKPVSLSQLKSCVVSNQFSNNHSSLNYSLPSFLHSILVDRTFRNIFPVCSKNANLILQYGDMNFISSDSSLGGSNEYDSTSLAQYISWQCVLGYGHPPKDSISFFIILLISFGFGVPLSLVFFAYTFGTLKILKSLRVDGNDSDSKEPSDTAYLLAPDINKDS
ncbi:uncharacterized protein LOC135926369 [Gordionus sp. m RMFG-2023]|uniref:uncharacterized protein LOC135926369 n=1 Tax=Gordionus sp. m RMFG-2023 TaxID=3053472 RepID=UPI0031FD98A4